MQKTEDTTSGAVGSPLDVEVRPREPKWYAFDSSKGSRQKRPPERKLVLVRMVSAKPGSYPEGIAVGYRKNAAGDKQSPYFVVPGLHTGAVLAWCDCLPEGFKWPNVCRELETPVRLSRTQQRRKSHE